MTRKRSRFFCRIRHQLKCLQAGTRRLGTLLLLLVLFLGAASLPTFAQIATENSIIQNLPDAKALELKGRKLYEAEQFSEAAKLWQQAADGFKATEETLKQAMILCNLSLAYQQLGQMSQAEGVIREALTLLNAQSPNLLQTERNQNTSTEQAQILAQALDVQARLHLTQGQAELALKTWKRTADIYTQVGDEAVLTRNHINQAQALQALGLYHQAKRILEDVKQILQKAPNSFVKATGLRSLGNVLRVVGDLKESQQVLEQSLAVASALQAPQAISETQLSLGNTARAQQDTQAALAYYRQAAAAISPTTQIQAQLNQLSLLLENQQLSAAQILWPQIQSQLSHLPPSRMAVYARINFAKSLMKLGTGDSFFRSSLLSGLGAGKEAGTGKLRLGTNSSSPSPSLIAQVLATAVQQAKTLKDQRATSYALGNLGQLYAQTQQQSEAINLTQQALLIAQSIEAPDIAYQWQWQLGRLLREQGKIQEALPAYTEAVNTLKSLRRDLVAINSDVQFSFRDEVEAVYRQLVDLLLRPQGTAVNVSEAGHDNVQTAQNALLTQENLAQAREVIESLQLAELENFLREACLVVKHSIDQVIDQEAQTAAAIYPIILPDRIEVILKLPQQPLHHYTTFIDQREAESILDELWQSLIEPDTLEEALSLSQQVYNWLVQPAVTDLTQSHIKTLVFVLDGSLRNIPMAALYNGQQYLVEKYGIALTPGLQLIDPKPLQQEQLKAIAAGMTKTPLGFYPLPNVKRELEEIQSEIPSRILFNEQFTAQALQNQMSNLPYPVIHLATHGQFSSNPDKTFIVAWDQHIYVKDLNKFLQTRNQIPPKAIELLVLSACQTAAGDQRAVLGLAGVAIRAGARSTLASLWNVNDESTALLMSQFYRELGRNQLNKAEALRQAQLALLKNPKYQRPMFWAPYVLVGNWL